MNTRHKTRRQLRGFTIIELLVASIIGLMSLYAVYHVFLRQEVNQRSTQTLNTLQNDGLQALFLLKQTVGNAGSGILVPDVFDALMGCSNADFHPLPALIKHDPTTTTVANQRFDEVTVVIGAPKAYGLMKSFTPILEQGTSTIDTTALPFQLAKNDVLVGIENNTCAWHRVSAVGTQNAVLKGGAGTHAQKVVNLGRAERVHFWVDTEHGNTLRQDRYAPNDSGVWVLQSSMPVISNVAAFVAQYGLDEDNDNKIDHWVEASGDWETDKVKAAGAKQIRKIKALRFALVVGSRDTRLADLDDDAEGKATIGLLTTCAPSSAECPDALTFQYLPEEDGKQRYRAFESSVAMINSVWNWQKTTL